MCRSPIARLYDHTGEKGSLWRGKNENVGRVKENERLTN